MESITWHIFNGLAAIAWLVCVVSWMRRGCPVPRWVHIFAGVMLLVGIIAIFACGMAGLLSLKLAASCLLVPPLSAYLGWLWMHGPDEVRTEK